MAKIPSYLLNLAGEYRVCSELNKRGIFATITYGPHKGADVYAIKNRKSLRIEVKTSQLDKFVTNLSGKGDDPNAPEFWDRQAENLEAPEFWVLFQIIPMEESGTFKERFFVLTHKELCGVQSARNTEYAAKYQEKHGTQWDFSTGVDSVNISGVERFENQWSKISDAFA